MGTCRKMAGIDARGATPTVAWISALLLLILIGLTGAPAEAQRTLSVQPPASSVGAGTTFTITVNIDDATSVAGFQFDLAHTTPVVTYTGGSVPPPGDLLNGLGWTIVANQLSSPTRVRVIAYRFPTSELSGGSGSLVRLQFTSGSSAGSSPFTLSGMTLSDGQSQAIPVVGTNGCVRVGSCDDGNGCTTDSLDPTTCACVNTAKNCADSDPCTVDSCDPQTGDCVNTPEDCDDGDACTADSCDPATGQCVHQPISCDDGNECTTDSCDSAGGCVHTPRTGQVCDDGNLCTSNDTCSAGGTCVGTPFSCDDNNPCTNDVCVPGSGCAHTPATGVPCDDGNACTTADQCTSSGSCTGAAKSCDDGNACTTDSCNPATGGCVHDPSAGQPCNDANGCTVNDTCQADGTCSGTPRDCDDGNACTADSCNPVTGQCVHTAVSCDDQNPCTTDTCDPTTGCLHTPKNCDDRKPCTVDTCDPATGNCLHAPKSCDDGNACTTDSCNSKTGACVNTARNCDDRNPCTVDTCDPVTGNCVHAPKNCDDGNACTTDSCNSRTGACVNTAKNCDDGDPCTVDTCDPVTGQCLNTPSGRVEVGITSFSGPSRAKVGQSATLTVRIVNSGCTDTWVQCAVTKPGQTIGTQNIWVPKGSTVTASFSYTFVASDVPNVCFAATISAAGDVNPANNQATTCTRVGG